MDGANGRTGGYGSLDGADWGTSGSVDGADYKILDGAD